jgi:hypothetical protein
MAAVSIAGHTIVLTNVLKEAGGNPTNNFSTGRFDTAGKIKLKL